MSVANPSTSPRSCDEMRIVMSPACAANPSMNSSRTSRFSSRSPTWQLLPDNAAPITTLWSWRVGKTRKKTATRPHLNDERISSHIGCLFDFHGRTVSGVPDECRFVWMAVQERQWHLDGFCLRAARYGQVPIVTFAARKACNSPDFGSGENDGFIPNRRNALDYVNRGAVQNGLRIRGDG